MSFLNQNFQFLIFLKKTFLDKGLNSLIELIHVFFIITAARSAVKILNESKTGEAESLRIFFSVVTGLTLACFLRFSLVLPNTSVWTNLFQKHLWLVSSFQYWRKCMIVSMSFVQTQDHGECSLNTFQGRGRAEDFCSEECSWIYCSS